MNQVDAECMSNAEGELLLSSGAGPPRWQEPSKSQHALQSCAHALQTLCIILPLSCTPSWYSCTRQSMHSMTAISGILTVAHNLSPPPMNPVGLTTCNLILSNMSAIAGKRQRRRLLLMLVLRLQLPLTAVRARLNLVSNALQEL